MTRPVAALPESATAEPPAPVGEPEELPRPGAHLPEGLAGFGVAELRFLLEAPGDSAARTIAVFGLDELEHVDTLLGAGASSLLARGFAILSGPRVELRSPAAMVRYAASNATAWTLLRLERDGRLDLAFVVESPRVLLTAQPRALGTWYLGLLSPPEDPAHAIAALAGALLDLHGPGNLTVERAPLGGTLTAIEVDAHRTAQGWVASPEGGECLDLIRALETLTRTEG